MPLNKVQLSCDPEELVTQIKQHLFFLLPSFIFVRLASFLKLNSLLLKLDFVIYQGFYHSNYMYNTFLISSKTVLNQGVSHSRFVFYCYSIVLPPKTVVDNDDTLRIWGLVIQLKWQGASHWNLSLSPSTLKCLLIHFFILSSALLFPILQVRKSKFRVKCITNFCLVIGRPRTQYQYSLLFFPILSQKVYSLFSTDNEVKSILSGECFIG